MTPRAEHGPKLLTSDDLDRLPRVPAEHRLPYGRDPAQFGDLYLPSSPGPHPIAIVIHGGCWRASFGLSHLEALCDAVRREGLAVWSVEYRRLGNGGGWPATFQDVATAADALRGIATRYALDLSRAIALGHSAGGHLALWMAGRHRLPLSSALSAAAPLPLRGVVSLAGIADLAAASQRNICGTACRELMGGSPAEVRERYEQGSPSALLPLGVRQWHIVGAQDAIVTPDYVRSCVARARRRDEVRLDVLPAAGHFEPIVPSSSAWPSVRRAVLTLAGAG